MRILLVEDQPDNADAIIEIIRAQIPEIEIFVARSKTKATAVLDARSFELIILDLQIPFENDDGLPAQQAHGEALLNEIKSKWPALIVVVLTAYGTIDLTSDVQNRFPQIWPLGDDKVPALSFKSKAHMVEIGAFARLIADQLDQIDGVELTEEGKADLTLDEKRLLKIVARKVDGVTVRTKRFGTGASNAKVLRVLIYDVHAQQQRRS